MEAANEEDRLAGFGEIILRWKEVDPACKGRLEPAEFVKLLQAVPVPLGLALPEDEADANPDSLLKQLRQLQVPVHSTERLCSPLPHVTEHEPQAPAT